MMSSPSDPTTVFLTGASGYIGGRLAPRLLERGYFIRCLARSPSKLLARPWSRRAGVEIVAGDLQDEASLAESMRGCRYAYYLVHSMLSSGSAYARQDRQLAASFARAAARAGVERIVYLGGLGETGDGLSRHLESRREVEKALASGPVPVTVLRAAMIIGSGSASFEILRYLVERLPVMITPRWVKTESQPIGIRNVLEYLLRTLEVPETTGKTLDIGGPDNLSYRELIHLMAAALGLRRRLIVQVPILTPRLSSLWIHLVTPLSRHIARPLAEGLRNRVVCRDDRAQRLMPQELTPAREAIELALSGIRGGFVETSWSDAGPMPGDPDWAGGPAFVDRRTIELSVPPNRVFWAICRIGGGNGWYAADALWRMRGFLDRLVGGPGLRRGRRDPQNIGYGDALDFWRVTGIEKNRCLALRAEMKLPGEALLEFEIENLEQPGKSRLVQTARFLPRGLLGLLYWYAVLPFHGFVFRGMLGGIQRAAESYATNSSLSDTPVRLS